MTLELRHVTKSVDGNVHIHDTSLTLEEGTFNVLLGTTLAGKTTLMQLMAGLDKPSSGEIWFRGKNVTGVAVQKRNVSMVYQQFINYPHLTVYENIASPLRVIGIEDAKIKERVGKVAELLRLAPMLQRKPAELSGGQQQRTAIARALVKDSDIILLDEPLANLDYKLREELRDELPRLFADRHCIVAYATTEPTEALLFGGNTATLHEGRVTQFGPTAAIYRQPNDLVSAQVFSDPPINTAPVTKANGRIQLDDGTNWPTPASVANAPDGAYTLAIRAHHITPDPAEWRDRDGRRPGAAGGTERLGKRAAFRPRRADLDLAVPWRPSVRSGRDRQALCRCRPLLPVRAGWAAWWEGAHNGEDHARPSAAQLYGRSAAPGGLGAEGDEPGAEGRRRLRAARAVGLRQDHVAEPDLRPACGRPTAASCSTARTYRKRRRSSAISRRCSSSRSSTTP